MKATCRFLNTDMGRELGHVGAVPENGQGLRPGERLRGHVPDRAQTDGAKQAPIRLRCRDGDRVSEERHGLQDDFKLNIEVNHSTLAEHTFQHELQTAADSGMLGSIDANRGDCQNGWDTDQFPLSVYETVEAMLVILEADGFQERRHQLRRQDPP